MASPWQIVIFLLLVHVTCSLLHHTAPIKINSRSTSRVGFRIQSSRLRETDTSKIQAPPDFDYLISLREKCERLSAYESEFLLSFWSDKMQCFQISPEFGERVSITTSCITLGAIMANPEHWSAYAVWDAPDGGEGENIDGKIRLRNVVDAIISAPWSGDVFQTQLLVSTLSNYAVNPQVNTKFIHAVDAVLEKRAKLSLHRIQPTSSYLRHQNVVALLAMVEQKSVPQHLIGSHRIGYALERANLVAFDELCRQLAFYNAGDSAHFDVIVLAYSLLSYWETSNSIFLSSFARGVVPATNSKLVQVALEVIFEVQSVDGTWRKGEPINLSGDTTGRDIGNNYVFFFDMVGRLLESIGSKQPQLLIPYLHNLERCIDWAENNIQQEMLSTGVDAVSGRPVGNTVKGWRSNNLGTGGAVCWCTAHVFTAITQLRKVLCRLINRNVLQEFDGREGPSELLTGSAREWRNLMDADLALGGSTTTLKRELYSLLLQPQKQKEDDILKSFRPVDTSQTNAELSETTSTFNQPLYSAILFGPPGTAKTTICTSMASFLGWNFVTVDTACFLADGLENIASRMRYVFSRLEALDRTIILFDEIEEFCLDRENPTLSMESRMLTTAMLTQLNELRRKQKSIFIVATNRLRSFDAAVTRPGRFDMLLFVGTPNLDARCQRLSSKLKSSSLISNDMQLEAVKMFAEYLEQHWESCRFLTFAENEKLLCAVVDLAERGMLSVEQLDAQVSVIAKTSIIQGPIREEYIASEVLSRV